MTEIWRVDLHNHTHWSADCLTQFDKLIEICHKRDIKRIAITDHNTADGALQMKQLAPELVIVGEEIFTTQGEILAYFVKESIPEGLTPQETIKRLREQNAVISISHPFDRLRKGSWREADLRRIVDQIDAIEVFNARCFFMEDNLRAIRFAQEHNLLGTAGSDAHTLIEYGTSPMLMRPFADDRDDFLDALREADFVRKLSSWRVHIGSKGAKWMKKLGLKPRMWAGG